MRVIAARQHDKKRGKFDPNCPHCRRQYPFRCVQCEFDLAGIVEESYNPSETPKPKAVQG